MNRVLATLAFALGLGAAAPSLAVAGVPSTLSFTARLVDDKTGDAVTGSHQLSFELFDKALAGTSVWKEARELPVEDGLLLTELGELKPLDASVFDGKALFLEVKLDGVTMDPRISIDSVPYAIHAASADAVGGMPAGDLQHRVTGTCGTGNFIIGVNADGTVSCAPDLSGTGDVTAVLAGTGLQGGAMSGDITLSLLQTCAVNQILKWSGSAWLCSADVGGTGITGVTVGAASGLTGGGSSGNVALSLLTSCAPNQVLKWSGAAWTCANDLDTDTNSGGDMTSVTTAIGTGLQGGATTGDALLSLLTTCAPNQLLKWNGSAWACAADLDSGGDVTDVVAGNGLTGGGASGALTVDVGAGTGITVSANAVALDTAFTDTRYVNATGDTLTGPLAMGGNRITGRGCQAGYVAAGPALCVEDPDASGFTFTGCANRCRANSAHMCSSAETRAAMASGATFTQTFILDWIDDQDAVGSALYVTSSDSNAPEAARVTTTASFCRCCADVE